jgi:PAS domain S-box-containing protein
MAALHSATGWNTGVDRLLFADAVRAAGGPDVGYPALFTNLVLVCFGIAILTLGLKEREPFHPTDLFAAFGIGILLLAVIGYIHENPIYYASESGREVSKAAMLLLLAGGAGLLMARPDRGLLQLLRDPGPVGSAARRLLPIPFLIPIFTAWLSSSLTLKGWVSKWYGQWLFSYANVVLYVLIIWRSMSMLLEANRRRRLAEDALQESYDKLDARVRDRTAEVTVANATLRAIIEASPLGILTIQPDGEVRICNRAAEELLESPDLAGKRLAAEPGTELHSILRRALNGEDLRGAEFEHRRSDGTHSALSAWSAPLRGDEDVQGFVLAFADLSDRRQLETELRQAQKMEAIGRLAGGVAHDFNNLLTAIIGLSDIVHEGLPVDEPLREEVLEIKTAGERAAGLTRQLLAFSRSQIVEPELINLNTVVPDMERMLGRLLGEDIEFATVCEPGVPSIFADRTQIEQVLLNLCINARDAMPEGGKLTIATRAARFTGRPPHQDLQPGAYAAVSVGDSGIGMDAQTKSRIFEPFFTTKPKGIGTGLGLSTVYGIVRQSKAAILVESEPGRGTKFEIFFPAADAPSGPEPLRQFLQEKPRGTETVLLVEDERSVRALARKVLASVGYRVLEAANAAEALNMAHGQDGPIHLLLTDVVLPHMGGRELAESLAMFYPNAKVLFMSGHTEDAIIRHGVLTRGIPFLHKPFTPDTLARKVREVLDS